MNGDIKVIENTEWRRVQRAVATDSFYACKAGRFDTVLITKKFRKSLLNSTRQGIDCWFGKIIRFAKTTKPKASGNYCCHDVQKCTRCDHSSRDDLCFVHWYEIINDSLVEIHTSGKELDCARLRWQRNPGENIQFESSGDFELVPVEGLPGLVQVVPKDLNAAKIDMNSYKQVSAQSKLENQ